MKKSLIRSCTTVVVMLVAVGALLAATTGDSLRNEPVTLETSMQASPSHAEAAEMPENASGECKLIRVWMWPGGPCWTVECCHEYCESDPECVN